MAERIQLTLGSGANTHMTFGRFEHLAPKVHGVIRACAADDARKGRLDVFSLPRAIYRGSTRMPRVFVHSSYFRLA